MQKTDKLRIINEYGLEILFSFLMVIINAGFERILNFIPINRP